MLADQLLYSHPLCWKKSTGMYRTIGSFPGVRRGNGYDPRIVSLIGLCKLDNNEGRFLKIIHRKRPNTNKSAKTQDGQDIPFQKQETVLLDSKKGSFEIEQIRG